MLSIDAKYRSQSMTADDAAVDKEIYIRLPCFVVFEVWFGWGALTKTVYICIFCVCVFLYIFVYFVFCIFVFLYLRGGNWIEPLLALWQQQLGRVYIFSLKGFKHQRAPPFHPHNFWLLVLLLL